MNPVISLVFSDILNLCNIKLRINQYEKKKKKKPTSFPAQSVAPERSLHKATSAHSLAFALPSLAPHMSSHNMFYYRCVSSGNTQPTGRTAV